jgi:hypothetical protein
MLYVILGRDAAGSLPRRLAARPAHLERLQALSAHGRLVLAGPLPVADATDGGVQGSLIVAEFASYDDAADWAKDDPYVAAGVYAQVEIYPFRQVLP